MPKHKKVPSLSHRNQWFQMKRKYAFVGLFVVLGSALLLVIRAASPGVSFEAENSNRSAPASVVTDNNASGGRAIQFGNIPGIPPQLAGNWRIVFQDDFNDPGKSFNENWEIRAPFSGNHPGQVSIANGALLLRTGTLSNYEWAYVSTSGPRSNTEPNYPKMKAWREGYFEARLRYTASEWSWPAFWLFSAAKSEAWPGENCPPGGFLDAEWDIMENGVQNGWQHRPAKDWFFTNPHRNTSDGTSDGYCGQPDQQKGFGKDMTGTADLSDWHTWGGRWIGNELCVYMDNQQLNCQTAWDTMVQPMEIHLDMNFHGSNCPSWCGPRPTALEMQVDWVRVWQR